MSEKELYAHKGHTQKPHRWNPKKDAQKCCGCGRDFKRGQLCFTDVAVTIHAGKKCVQEYLTM